ncbi:MAG TPA: hypothetical protein DCD96_08225 [Flavobacteriales bacterium]|nr:hypothetical protein [Flavobacteriales bacterium]HRE75367.1 hypothetical protein [Flavobacteriales bacterium]
MNRATSIVLFFLAQFFPGENLTSCVEGIFVKNGRYYSEDLQIDSEHISISGLAYNHGVLTQESMLILDSLFTRLTFEYIDHIEVKSYGTGNDESSLLKSRQRNAQSVVDYFVLSGKIDTRKLIAFNYAMNVNRVIPIDQNNMLQI